MTHLPFWQVANSRALEREHARGSSESLPLTRKDSHSWGALGTLTWDSEQTAGVGPGELTFPPAHVAAQWGDLYCPGACLCCWNLTAEEGGGRRVSFPRASRGGGGVTARLTTDYRILNSQKRQTHGKVPKFPQELQSPHPLTNGFYCCCSS